MLTRHTLSRRDLLIAGGAAAGALVLPTAAHSWFIAGMLGRALTGFVGRTAAANTARVGLGGVSTAARARALQSAQLLRARGTQPREGLFGTYGRSFAQGMGNEMGKAAGRAVVRAIGEGWGEMRGRGRPFPGRSDEDDVYVVFPNDGFEQAPMLGCPEIALLEIMLDVVVRRFITRGYAMSAELSTAMIFPLVGLELPRYDDIWNSRTPTVYESGYYVVRHVTFGMQTPRAHVRTTVWRNTDFGTMSNVPFTSRAPEFEDSIPLIN